MPRFVITGPSGWIGQALLAHLARRLHGPLAGYVTLFASSARQQTAPSGEGLPVRDLASITGADVAGAHVIHLAYLTKDKVAALGEGPFAATNLAIDSAVLAAITAAWPASLFVASSGAAALAQSGADLHPYGMAKLEQEARFLGWGRQTGVPVLAGRIFNIAGPYMNKLSAYALSNFVQQALTTGHIAIAAKSPVFRSFLHVDDLCALIAGAAQAGLGRAAPVDLCGAEVLEMADLAERVAGLFPVPIPISRSLEDLSVSSAYLGHFAQTRVLAMALDHRLAPFDTQLADTLTWVKTHIGAE